MKKIALLIEWNPSSGKRAGHINPRDANLRCNNWQNMYVTPALELRLIEDNRDIKQYKGIEGVTIIEGIDQINAEIDANFPIKYIIEDDLIFSEHFKEKVKAKKIDIDNLPDNQIERLKELKKTYHIKGIVERKPLKV